jgi:hypothetical protein
MKMKKNEKEIKKRVKKYPLHHLYE